MRRFVLVLLSCLLSSTIWAQGTEVTGRVTSAEDGLGIPGVNVVVEGTSKGTATDVDGNYTILLEPGENTLVYSFVGFKTVTMQVDGRSTIDVTLESDVTALEEVVVVGYGEQRKIDITGSVANVQREAITKQPTVNAISALQGRVAGVQITNSGEPGASPEIRIRGTGTVHGDPNPLYVVDGVWYDDISFLNPNDIENMSILKDASSQAIYGVRAANGVVLITTRKGRREGPATVTYDGYVGSQVVTNQVEMASGPEYATLINELNAANGEAAVYENPESYGTTDWFRQILRAGLISSHQISVAGGGEKSTYNFSLGYLDQDGTVEGHEFKRYTARLQSDFDAFDFLKIGYSVTGSMINSQDIPGGIFHELYAASPITPVYYADGTYGDPYDYQAGGSNLFNPQATLDFYDQDSKNYRMTGNVFAELTFLKNFTFRTSLGGDYGQNELRGFNQVYAATLSQRNDISVLRRERAETRNWIVENTLTYKYDKSEDHGLTFMLGQGAQRNRFYKIIGRAENVPNNSDADHYFSLGDPRFIEDEGELNTIVSYFARANYSFRDRYLLTASLRADGSSKFGVDDKWGYFPSVGLGWVISEEDFMQTQSVFNNLKLRGSWGKIGNSSVPANTSVARVTQVPEFVYVGGNGATFPGASINTITPPTTVWETGVGTDIGIEANFMDFRLTAEVDYYIKDTKEAIFDIPILTHLGTSGGTIIGNQATFRNSGFEFMLNWNDQPRDDFSYTISANLAINDNEVLEVATGRNPIEQAVGTTGGARNTRTIVGYPIGHFFGYEVEGVFQNQQDIDAYTSSSGDTIQSAAVPGDFKYRDLNDDGRIDGNDRVVLGNPNPRVTYGLNTTWRYKHFDLTLDFQGVAGVELYNATLGARFGRENFTHDFYEHRWHGEGTSNEYPSANIGGGNNFVSNSFFVERGDYFRVRTIQLGFTLPSSVTENWKINSLRVYANAQNALNFFSYRGMTPEIGGEPTRAGVDTDVYPMFATYNFGVNVSF